MIPPYKIMLVVLNPFLSKQNWGPENNSPVKEAAESICRWFALKHVPLARRFGSKLGVFKSRCFATKTQTHIFGLLRLRWPKYAKMASTCHVCSPPHIPQRLAVPFSATATVSASGTELAVLYALDIVGCCSHKSITADTNQISWCVYCIMLY